MFRLIRWMYALIFISGSAFSQEAKLMIPSAHNNSIQTLSYSPDDQYFFSVSFDGTKIWKSSDLKLIKNLPDDQPQEILAHPAHPGWVLLVGFHKIKWFDMDRFEVGESVANDSINFSDAVISPDGKAVYLSGVPKSKKRSMVVWKFTIESKLWEKIFDEPDPDLSKNPGYTKATNLQINSEGTELLFNSHYQNTYLVDIQQKTLIRLFPVEEYRIQTFTPSGNLLEMDKPEGKFTFRELSRQDFSTVRQFEIDRKGLLPLSEFKKNFTWSPGKKGHLLLLTEELLYEVNVSAGTLVRSSTAGGANKRKITAGHGGNKILVGSSRFIDVPALISQFDYSGFRLLGRAGIPPFTLTDLDSYPNFGQLGMIGTGGFAKTMRLQDNGLQIVSEKTDRPGYESVHYVAIQPTGNQALMSANYEWLIKTSASPPYQDYEKYDGGYGSGFNDDIFYSPDGTLIGSVGKRALVRSAADGAILGEYDNGDLGILLRGKLGAISSNNELFVFVGEKKTGDNSKTNILHCYRISTGELLWEITLPMSELQFRNGDKIVSGVTNGPNPDLVQINAITGEILKSTSLYGLGDFNQVTTSVDGSSYFFAKTGAQKILEYTYPDGAQKRSMDGAEDIITVLESLPGGEFLISGSFNGAIQLWDLTRDQYVAKLFLFNDSDDWVILDPKGRFDASTGAMNRIYYTKGKYDIPLEAVYEAFYTPLLLARILSHLELPDPEVNALNLPPTVKINYAEKTRNLSVEEDVPSYTNTSGVAELRVEAKSMEDQVEEIRLFHNGKIVNLATRGLFVTDDAGSDTKTYTVNLLPGANTFRAVALNSQRTESKPDEIQVSYQPGSGSPNTPKIEKSPTGPLATIDRNATLHLLVVGINAYQNPSMSLNYALADAQSFKDEVEKDAKSVLSKVQTYFITDADAKKDGISEAFERIKATAKPEDVFIFYYAGHGVIGQDGEFYLVPTDVSNLRNVQEELIQKAIPAKLMQEYAIQIPAQKQLFILDACQSAGAFEELLAQEGSQQKSIAVVSRSTGTHWIAASGAKQFANEFAQLGHGAFTYVLLEALQGAAQEGQWITVNGLKNYLQIKVPELMKKYSGTQQFPASYGFGNDFPIEEAKN